MTSTHVSLSMHIFILMIFSSIAIFPSVEGKKGKGVCRRQNDICLHYNEAESPAEKCCAGLTCVNEGYNGYRCRKASEVGCIAERQYCGLNAPDKPCCDPLSCLQETNSEGNVVWLCASTRPYPL
ncbi:hypothetical protein IWZ03DRAFT_383778 [Phyllosticta citriasiana]|uniref:Uncharacterized protein n=1 Tax=Phyllosticta citriasiana TaxID=595635 RepID=A0ABR1KI72_9PEZI